MSRDIVPKPNGLHGYSGNETSNGRNGSTREVEQAQAVASPPQVPERSWLDFAGSFADDPFWDEMMETIEQDRQKMDARYGGAG